MPRAKAGKKPTLNIWRGPFLAALARTGNWTASARAAGIDRQTAYNYRHKNPTFAAECEAAIAEALEVLEARLWDVASRDPADGGDWRATLAVLERRDPDKWAAAQKLHHSGKLTHDIRTLQDVAKEIASGD